MSHIEAPNDFLKALGSLRGHVFRQEIHVTQIPPPRGLAPWAVALRAEINESTASDPAYYRGSARFIVLYDPDGQAGWNGPCRIVCQITVPIDLDMCTDPLFGEMVWERLADALHQHEAPYHSLLGTVTRVYNETFGGMDLQEDSNQLELRASWSPEDPDLSGHLSAWADFIASAAGLAPEGVVFLRPR
ncbi:Protein of unknown function [Actinobaculum suis]|uniref:DUF3000 domain-containing protein n=1 Tax=Actinobaculum suis TaxID=1657 RepID=A0A1G7BLZ5_9ACTO|nr:DUF3000 domain-containing protein [Actinobaculum suis]MDY5153766.1 DUF3000 domain-containing protein [Actinobaculum suis]SDE27947.1 Protein of unknown function [Actinobaculum suis]